MTPQPDEFDQGAMLHQLPKARIVNRIDYLVERARGKRVIHVGFADAGCAQMQSRHDAWLHAKLAAVSTELVGLDVDEAGVASAAEAGYEVYALDCTDPQAVAGLGLRPGDVVIAGEVIEHVDNPGAFLDGLRSLCAERGEVIVTTPNASGWFNSVAAAINREINHPDHIVMFSWRTLTTLMQRHGLRPVDAATFVPEVKSSSVQSGRGVTLAARAVVGVERLVGRFAPFVADGMIVTARVGG